MNDSLNNSVATTSKRKTLEDYEVCQLPGNKTELGRGSYGTVKLVVDRAEGKRYAMKVMVKK